MTTPGQITHTQKQGHAGDGQDVLKAGTVMVKEGSDFVLERDQRLSRSVLWELQRNYYDRMGVEAWLNGQVPHYITSNLFIASAYARVVSAYIRDWQRAASTASPDLTLDPDQPLYIVELGSGPGRFAYHFLKKFQEIHQQAAFKDIRVTYLMTDFTERNIDYWRSHPSFQPFVGTGLLDFANFEVGGDDTLTLVHSGAVLSPETVGNPMVVVANYLFDSVPQDAFYVASGQLFESLTTVLSPDPNPDLNNMMALYCMDTQFNRKPIESAYYDNPEWNRVLEDYRQRLSETAFLFPTAAIRCIETFRRLSKDRLLVLTGDKGPIHETDLQGQRDPTPIMTGGFSLSVNYNAIGQYITNQGGLTLHTAHHHTSLNVCAFLLGSPPYAETRQSYDEAIETFGPDDFFIWQKNLDTLCDQARLEQVFVFLRQSGWDIGVVLSCLPRITQLLDDISDRQQQELYHGIMRAWDAYFPMAEIYDPAFHLGTLLLDLQYYTEALDLFRCSEDLHGQKPETTCKMGVCYMGLGRVEKALEYLHRTLEQDPEYSEAQALSLSLTSEVSVGEFQIASG